MSGLDGPAPVFSVADFAAGLMRLLPQGPAWPREADSVVAQVIGSQAGSYARLHARSNALLIDAFPATTSELLPEWEWTLGLPDPCAGPDQSFEQRQAHVVARLVETDGPSIPSLTAFAAALGFVVTIEEFAPAIPGRLRAGQPLYGAAWAHAWRVHAPAISVHFFLAGQGRAGDPLETYGNLVLVCELGRLSPAHTKPIFAFGS